MTNERSGDKHARALWLADKLVGDYGSEAAQLLRWFGSQPSARATPDWEGRYKLMRRFLVSGEDYAPMLLMKANTEQDFDEACDALIATDGSTKNG